MINRPYVLLSCAMSMDGYIDDASDARLVLSNDADLARVNAVRAGVDAILVGANTIRRDNPRLLVRDLPARPLKVTLTSSGDLDPDAQFFTEGDTGKLVYTVSGAADKLTGLATVIDCGPTVDLPFVLADLHTRGVRRLMVEGGGGVLTQFLTAGVTDELQLVVAPLLIGDPQAPRFVHSGRFGAAMTLAEVRKIGDVALLRYLFGQAARDWHWLRLAIELSRLCPPSERAFSVGAIIVDASGNEISRGYSRESDASVHAEEAALGKADPAALATATLYSSLEPCSSRASRPRSCTRLIVEAGLQRVVFALREPGTFVDGMGAEELAAAGLDVVEIPDLADEVLAVNQHLV